MGKQNIAPVLWGSETPEIGVTYRFPEMVETESRHKDEDSACEKRRKFTTGRLTAISHNTYTFVGKKIRPNSKKSKKSRGEYIFEMPIKKPTLVACSSQ